jgi:hypothetical protein
MSVLAEAVAEIMTQTGTICCAIVDIETGECLSRFGVAITGTLEAAALINARMLRAKLRLVDEQSHETIEDILITLDRHYHIIRLIHCGDRMPSMFFYLVLDKGVANLAIARRKLAAVERHMVEFPEAVVQLEAARSRALIGEEKVPGSGSDDDELPPFMREDVAMKLLGIKAAEENYEF